MSELWQIYNLKWQICIIAITITLVGMKSWYTIEAKYELFWSQEHFLLCHICWVRYHKKIMHIVRAIFCMRTVQCSLFYFVYTLWKTEDFEWYEFLFQITIFDRVCTPWAGREPSVLSIWNSETMFLGVIFREKLTKVSKRNLVFWWENSERREACSPET